MPHTCEISRHTLGLRDSTNKPRAVYTCDVGDAEWEFCQPYLLQMSEDAPHVNIRCTNSSTHCAILCGAAANGS
jgi:hypothetical protein